MDHVTRPRPFQERFLIYSWDLLCLTEVSTTTCNKDVKGNAKCKNSRSETPFGQSWITQWAKGYAAQGPQSTGAPKAKTKNRRIVDFRVSAVYLGQLLLKICSA